MSITSSSALENLVTQLTTPFDALRELVQNSIDAGSSGIEIWCEYEYTEKHGVSRSILMILVKVWMRRLRSG